MTMADVAAIGEQVRVAGFALGGADVVIAEDPGTVWEAWRNLPDDIGLVIVTPAAAEALGPAVLEGDRPLVAVMPR